MKVKEIYAALSKRIPSELSCEWDNDGLMVCPDPDREVKRVLIALDITEAANTFSQPSALYVQRMQTDR